MTDFRTNVPSEIDIAWLFLAWWLIHQPDPPPPSYVQTVDPTSLFAAGTLASNLSVVHGSTEELTLERFQERLRPLGIEVTRHDVPDTDRQGTHKQGEEPLSVQYPVYREVEYCFKVGGQTICTVIRVLQVHPPVI